MAKRCSGDMRGSLSLLTVRINHSCPWVMRNQSSGVSSKVSLALGVMTGPHDITAAIRAVM